MSEVKPTSLSSETEPMPVDISDRVRAMFGCKNTGEKMNLMFALKGDFKDVPALNITLDYTTLDHAKWVKGWIEYGGSSEQKRTAAIRATESQMKDAANVFASGVEWIEIKK